MALKNKQLFERRRERNRTKLRKVGKGRPRLSVFRSANHIYAQVIDDDAGKTICSASTIEKDLKDGKAAGGNKEAAVAVGKRVAERALAAGVSTVVFDRGGYIFHGRVKALADAAREGGLQF